MKNIIAVIAAAVVCAPLFAAEPSLETQKHDSSLMMDGMKSVNSQAEASLTSKEQTESINKESAAILKDTKLKVSPAVLRVKAEQQAAQANAGANVPVPNSGTNSPAADNGGKEQTLDEAAGTIIEGAGAAISAFFGLISAIVQVGGAITH